MFLAVSWAGCDPMGMQQQEVLGWAGWQLCGSGELSSADDFVLQAENVEGKSSNEMWGEKPEVKAGTHKGGDSLRKFTFFLPAGEVLRTATNHDHQRREPFPLQHLPARCGR